MRAYRGVTALWILIAVGALFGLSAMYPAYGEICETGQKDCATYGLTPFLLIKIGKSLDAMSAAITAVATVVIGWFTITLAKSTDKMWEASTIQLDHAENTAERQLRAYVYVDKINVIENRPGQIFRAELVIKNFGQTPAYDVRPWVRFDASEPANFDGFAERPAIIVEGPVDLGPGQIIKLDTNSGIVFTTAHYAAIRDGDYLVFVYGDIQSRSRKSAQDDKWSFCLTAGTLWPANQERP